MTTLGAVCSKRVLKNDLAAVQEVRGLISEIDSAWQLLPSVLSAPSSAIAS